MDDGFDQELAALRQEVGEFVIEVLRRDNSRITEDVARDLAGRLNGMLRVTADLSARDTQLLENVERAIARFEAIATERDPKFLREPEHSPSGWTDRVVKRALGAAEIRHPTPRHRPYEEERVEQRGIAGFSVWWICCLASLCLGIGGAVGWMATIVPRDQDRATHQDARGDAMTTETPSVSTAPPSQPLANADVIGGGSIGGGWRAAIRAATALPEPDRDNKLKALCGSTSALDTCTFEARRAEWANNPKMAAKGLAALRDLLKPGLPCLASSIGTTEETLPTMPFVACTLERQP